MHYVESSEGAGNGTGPTFVMKHKDNLMVVITSKPNEVWYGDSGASNHMTSHEEWFSYLEKPEKPGVVKIGDEVWYERQGELDEGKHLETERGVVC